MERGRASRSAKCRIGVAREAKQVHCAVSQHVLIGSAVRHMARRAAFGLDRIMLEDKRALNVRVTLEANRTLLRRHPYLLREYGTVRIMAIVALNQSLEYPVPKRHVELPLLRQMARETQLRLGLREEKFFRFCMMGRVAVSTTDTILCVHRIDGVHMLGAPSMAAHATRIDLLC